MNLWRPNLWLPLAERRARARRAWQWRRRFFSPSIFARGDVLLDAAGNVLLDSAGSVMLAGPDGYCCCGTPPPPGEPCGFCPDGAPSQFNLTVTSPITLCTECEFTGEGAGIGRAWRKIFDTSFTGSAALAQQVDQGNFCYWETLVPTGVRIEKYVEDQSTDCPHGDLMPFDWSVYWAVRMGMPPSWPNQLSVQGAFYGDNFAYGGALWDWIPIFCYTRDLVESPIVTCRDLGTLSNTYTGCNYYDPANPYCMGDDPTSLYPRSLVSGYDGAITVKS